jgi:cytochrome P450
VAFGQGMHHCLGSPLARQEMNAASERLVARRTGFALSERRNRFEFVETLALRIPKDLWIRTR